MLFLLVFNIFLLFALTEGSRNVHNPLKLSVTRLAFVKYLHKAKSVKQSLND